MTNRYSLNQVAKLVAISVSTLMRWEKLGWIAPPQKRAPRTNIRMYTDAEVAVIIQFRDGTHGPSPSSKALHA